MYIYITVLTQLTSNVATANTILPILGAVSQVYINIYICICVYIYTYICIYLSPPTSQPQTRSSPS